MKFLYETEDTRAAGAFTFPPTISGPPGRDLTDPLPPLPPVIGEVKPTDVRPNEQNGNIQVLLDPCNVINQETGDKFESLLDNMSNPAPEIQLTRGFKSVISMRGCVNFTGMLNDHTYAGVGLWLASVGIGKDCLVLGSDRKTPCPSGAAQLGNIPGDLPEASYSMKTLWDRFKACMEERYPEC